jgi:hypothetical protein
MMGFGDSSYEWYRGCASSGSTNGITTSNFAKHVAGCLAEAPIDGLCKAYSGKSFSGYTDNYIGMMPYWDVSAVTDMSEAFKDKDTFNADLSSWDVSSVENMNDMFNGASSFNQDISGWNVDSSGGNNHQYVQWCDRVPREIHVHFFARWTAKLGVHRLVVHGRARSRL